MAKRYRSRDSVPPGPVEMRKGYRGTEALPKNPMPPKGPAAWVPVTSRKDDDQVTIALRADLNARDDDGLGWSTLREARNPEEVQPGALLIAGNEQAAAVVSVVAVDDDGQVHFSILPGSVAENRHLLDRNSA